MYHGLGTAIQMDKPKLQLGIKASVTDSSVLELFILDYLYDSYEYDWSTDTYTETNWVADVIAKVKDVNPSRILLTIDCLGGDAAIGIALYNFLKNCSAKVEVDVIGMCGSSATLPAMAASKGKLRMARNSFMIIHEAWGGGSGRSKDLREQAEVVDKFTRQYADIYALKSGKTVDEILALIAPGDYWMTGAEAVEQGFADEIYNDAPKIEVMARIGADFSAAGYHNIPKNLIAAAAAPPVLSEQNEPLPGAFNALIMDFKNKVNAFIDTFKKGTVNAKAPNLAEEVATVMAGPMTDLATALQEEVSAEISGMEERISASVSTALVERMEAIEKANERLKDENAELKKEISASIGKATSSENTEGEEKKSIGRWAKRD